MSIFVNIAGYADPEILPTILDCMANARDPDALRFGVCWQRHPGDESLTSFVGKPWIRIDDVPAMESRGCCWARARSQALYDGEDFVLQLDSHHRFEPHWDKTLIDMMHETGAAKPMLTSYGAGYDAETGKNYASEPCKMVARPFCPDGTLLFVGAHVTDKALGVPAPARFFSGHFMFTLGQHCREVPYDPNLYFHGEESTMGARSWTHGYDMFHPRRIVVWHQYHRDGRRRHWDDQAELKRELDLISKARVRKLFRMEENDHDLTGFDVGQARPLDDYERFAGVDFKGRRLHQDAIDGVSPPTPFYDDRWAVHRRILMFWASEKVTYPPGTTKMAYFVDDKEGKMLWHTDVGPENDFQPPPFADFWSYRDPDCIVVWPHIGDKPHGVKYRLPLTSQTIHTAC